MEQEKCNEFGILRAFGVLAVISIHVTSVFQQFGKSTFSYSFFGIINKFCNFAVPLFLFLSVALSIVSTIKKGELNVLEFYKKRFLKTLPPFIIWVLLYCAYSKFNNVEIINFTEEPQKFFTSYILQGTIYYHLYFMPIIFQLYVIFPIIYFVTINLRKIKININISFILSLALLMILQYVYQQIHKYYIWPYFQNPAIIVFAYTVAIGMGAWVGANYDEIKKWRIVNCVSLLLAVIFGYIFVYNSVFTAGSISNLVYPMYTAMAALVLLGFARFIMQRCNKINSVLCKIGKHSFDIYLIHPIVLNEMQKYISSTNFSNYYLQNKSIQILLNFMITLTVTYLISVCIQIFTKCILQLIRPKKVFNNGGNK